jgi:hypothetical protein
MSVVAAADAAGVVLPAMICCQLAVAQTRSDHRNEPSVLGRLQRSTAEACVFATPMVYAVMLWCRKHTAQYRVLNPTSLTLTLNLALLGHNSSSSSSSV